MSGTAIQGSNYSLSGTPRLVTIPAGASSANITLTALRGAKRAKSATMTLNTGAGYNLSSSRSASVSIRR